jgi:hypothetical protein
MAARLGSSLIANALLRLAGREGGFGAVLAKGDPDAGAITVILAERGARRLVLERVVEPDGRYCWHQLQNRAAANDEEFERFVERRRRLDPDLWLIELDVPSAERFADEMDGVG